MRNRIITKMQNRTNSTSSQIIYKHDLNCSGEDILNTCSLILVPEKTNALSSIYSLHL